MNKIFIKAAIFFVKIYKYFFSPLLGNRCRFLPTCSEYFIECLNEYGFFKGVTFGFKRIIKCHPIKFLGGSSGLDLVPKKRNVKNG
jgi:putative membrane protein insertion efficiency factor|tara:strand:- start:277 stop:534 length:258 start_codon:yes stop_codon:yes gene_type:complete